MSKLYIHTDGSCYHKDGRMGLGMACFLDDSLKPFYTKGINKHQKLGTNNEAEYLAVINALIELNRVRYDADEIFIYTDSQLVVNQINGVYLIKEDRLQQLCTEVHRLLKDNPIKITFIWCPRQNPRQKIADKLSKKANPYFIHKKKPGY